VNGAKADQRKTASARRERTLVLRGAAKSAKRLIKKNAAVFERLS
jgi:hypothetical protein